MKPILTCDGIAKKFGKTTALEDITLRMEENTIYGLLGRNGAGKTTLLHIITGQLAPNQGQVTIHGHQPFENVSAQRLMCFVKDKHDFPRGFTVEQVLRLGAMFYPNWDAALALRLLGVFELDAGKKIKQLSRGMESAVGIILGIASHAPLTIFDEPYLGLDAVARERFYDVLLDDYEKFPRTIVLSTHLIDEVAKLFEHVFMIDKGKLLVDANTDLLREQYCRVTGHAEEVGELITGKRILHRQQLGTTQSIAVEGPFSEAEIHAAEKAGVEISGLSIQQLLVYLTDGEAQKEAVR